MLQPSAFSTTELLQQQENYFSKQIHNYIIGVSAWVCIVDVNANASAMKVGLV
jgi:hypothetical protein